MNETLLLLDDDPTMLGILEGILTGAGYACVTTTDAQEALSLITTHPAVAVVLSDIFMPGLTGLQLVHRMNALELDRPTPRVLLLTAQPSLESAVDALRLGARDFLVKPVRPQELIEAVERALTQARVDRTTHSSRPPQVEQLVRQAEELASRLRGLAYSSGESTGEGTGSQYVFADSLAGVKPAGEPSMVAHAVPLPSAAGSAVRAAAVPSVLDTIEQLRRLRNKYEHHRLDDVAWDLLLELLRAERLRQRLSVSGLTISISGVSATTSLRRANELTTRGYISRIPDPDDARRDFVSLTPKANELLADYLAHANAHLHDLTGHEFPLHR